MSQSRLVSTIRRGKYFNPNSPRHVGHYVSPIPDYISSIYDSELAECDRDLSRREELLLIDLKRFHDGVSRYKAFKRELQQIAAKAENGLMSPADISSHVKTARAVLDERSKTAEEVFNQPIPDYTDDERVMHEVEAEVEALVDQLPKESANEVAAEAAKLAAKIQALELANHRIRNNVRERQKEIDNDIEDVEQSLMELEKMENEEELLNLRAMKEKENFDALPKFDVNQAIEKERKMKELEQRKMNVALLREKIKTETKKAKEVEDKEQSEINALLEELEKNTDQNDRVKSIFAQLKKANEMKLQLKQSLLIYEEELSVLLRKYEIQMDDLKKIEEKKQNLMKRESLINEKKKKLDEKERDIQIRKKNLENSEESFQKIRAELDEIKKRIENADNEVAKYEKLTKEMMEKVSRAQEILDSKSIEVIDAPSKENLNDLQNLISGAK